MKSTIFSKINSNFFLIALLLFSMLGAVHSPARAGLVEGLAAYDQADFATALKELAPLAEKGDAIAQYKIAKMTGLGQGVSRDVYARRKLTSQRI